MRVFIGAINPLTFMSGLSYVFVPRQKHVMSQGQFMVNVCKKTNLLKDLYLLPLSKRAAIEADIRAGIPFAYIAAYWRVKESLVTSAANAIGIQRQVIAIGHAEDGTLLAREGICLK
ncbi:MAG: hypothetical protein KGJ13_07540 [Patescibacteria group bacterium]|nr:hypothetical protein [Patescibacteria group bacterium]